LSLPPQGEQFSHSEFICVDPASWDSPARGEALEPCSITVVMEPEAYTPEQISWLPRPLWLWSFQPLTINPGSDLAEAPRLGQQANERVVEQLDFITSLSPDSYDVVVVPDTVSRDVLGSRGIFAIVSPPPVSDHVFDISTAELTNPFFGTANTPGSYRDLYLRDSGVDLLAWSDQKKEPGGTIVGLASLTHGVSINHSANRSFPFEAAVHLALGHTLISEPLRPLHGLEPGKDYFEVSSPVELCYVLQHMERHPGSTQLMAYRGRGKASYFLAGAVFAAALRATGWDAQIPNEPSRPRA